MDVRCLCSPPLRPFSNTSSAFHSTISDLPSPEPSLFCQSCQCSCHAARCYRGQSSHHNQSCIRPTSEYWACSTTSHRPGPINQCPPCCVPKGHHAIYFDRCAHVQPWRPTIQVDRSGMPPVAESWAVFSRDPMHEVTDLTEHQPMLGNCTVYSLGTRGLDSRSQQGYCTPCLPMHYAVYSSPVSVNHSPKERGHRFCNNIPPVLLAVHSKEQGSPSYVEELPQIDRSPTPSVPASCWAFSGD